MGFDRVRHGISMTEEDTKKMENPILIQSMTVSLESTSPLIFPKVTNEKDYAIPALALKSAIISAASDKVLLRKSVFINFENMEKDYVIPIKKKGIHVIENKIVVAGKEYFRQRGQVDWWEADVKIEYKAKDIHFNEILNILDEAGSKIGLLEHRPGFRFSGFDNGCFRVTKVVPTGWKMYYPKPENGKSPRKSRKKPMQKRYVQTRPVSMQNSLVS